jgi:hypothetical protein
MWIRILLVILMRNRLRILHFTSMLIQIRILLSKPCKGVQIGSYSIHFGYGTKSACICIILGSLIRIQIQLITLMVIQILPFNVMRIRNTCICQPHIHLDPEPVYHFYEDLDPTCTFQCCADQDQDPQLGCPT